jgi:ASC-1-like (ASCH) protein
VRLKEDEKRTEVRVHNAQRQRKKDGDNGTFTIPAVARPSPRLRSGQAWPSFHGLEARATVWLLLQSRM